jgi:protocatechuate 3,4-dioxygenase, alpha subunit
MASSESPWASRVPTPSQTVGPFFHIGLSDEGRSELVPADDPDAIEIEGIVFDGEGTPVVDALIEIWQANSAGRYNDPQDSRAGPPLDERFSGFGRCATDDDGRFRFRTVKPGKVPGPEGTTQAPHIEVSVFARGLLKRLVTRIYFPGETEANRADPVLAQIDDPDHRATLLAVEEDGGYRFDIRLQGDRETAFFDI